MEKALEMLKNREGNRRRRGLEGTCGVKERPILDPYFWTCFQLRKFSDLSL